MLTKRAAFSRLLRQSGAYSIAVLADRACAVILLPVYTRVLAPSDYGVMELLDFTTSLVGMMIGVRLGQAVAYFYTANDESTRQRYVSSALLGSLAVGVLVCCLVVAISGQLSQIVFHSVAYRSYFRLLAVSLSSSLPMEVGLSYIQVRGQAWLHTKIRLCRLLLSVTLMIVLVVQMRMAVAGWLWSAVGASLPVAIYVIWHTMRKLTITFDFSMLYTMFRYSAPLNISALAMFVIHFGDRWFLRNSVSLADLGIYGLAYKLGMLIAYVQVPFSIFWNSQMYSLVGQPDGEQLYVRICTYATLAYAFAAVALSAFIHPLVLIGVGSSFRGVTQFVPYIAVAYVIRALAEFVRSVFLLENRTDLDAWITAIGGVVCLAGYEFLIPTLKLWGAIMATGLTFVSMLLLSFWRGQKLKHYPYEWKRLILIGVSMAVFTAAPLAVKPSSFLAGIAFGGAVVCAFPIALLVSGFLLNDEKAQLKILAAGIRQKLFSPSAVSRSL